MIVLIYFIITVVTIASALFITEKDLITGRFDFSDYVFVTFIGFLWPISIPFFLVLGLY